MMKWTTQANEVISRVPFFIRKRVRTKVEEEARQRGDQEVRLDHVHACRKRFLGNMEDEVKGYQIETCFGTAECSNKAVDGSDLPDQIEKLVAQKDLKTFLKKKVKGTLKMHHEFRISISDCPNACSRPQIADIGLLGARRPLVGGSQCNGCGACHEVCRENAILFSHSTTEPTIDSDRCLWCGQCIRICPSGTIEDVQSGYRILLGGKLGRHPQLAREVGGIFSNSEVLRMIQLCIEHHLEHNTWGERFGEVLKRFPMEFEK